MGQNASAQSFAGDRLVAVHRQIGEHLDAATAKRGRERFAESHHVRFGAQQFDANLTVTRMRGHRRPRRRHRRAGSITVRRHGDRTGRQIVVEFGAIPEVEHERIANTARGECS